MIRWMILWLHRYLGIALGILVVLAMTTGSLAVFAPEIDRWLNPELFTVPDHAAGEDDSRKLEGIAQRAIASYPGRPGQFQPAFAIMRLPLTRGDSVEMLMIDSFREPHGPWWQVYADPGTGELLGSRNAQEHLAGKLIGLHIGLLSGEHSIGTQLIGIGGILLIFFIITGVYLWWPGLKRLPQGFYIRKGRGRRAFWLDMHQVSGVVMTVPMLVFTITGLFYVYPQVTRVPLEQWLDIPDRPEAPLSITPGTAQAPIGIDHALDSAGKAFPAARATSITIPSGQRGAYRVRKRFADDPHQHYNNGNALVWVDQYTGEVLKSHDARSRPVLTRLFHDWIFPIHSGEIAGLTGRWTAFVSGLLPLGLFIMGLYCWWKMKRRRLN